METEQDNNPVVEQLYALLRLIPADERVAVLAAVERRFTAESARKTEKRDQLLIALRVWDELSTRSYNGLCDLLHYRFGFSNMEREQLRLSMIAEHLLWRDIARAPNLGRECLIEIESVLFAYGWQLLGPSDFWPEIIAGKLPRERNGNSHAAKKRAERDAIDQEMLRLKTDEKATYQQIAERYSISYERVKQRIDRERHSREKRERYPLELPGGETP